MLLADQQVRYDADPNMSLIADTTLFYEPILEEYGYTKADYVKSVGKYMEDPEKFADIFKAVSYTHLTLPTILLV